MGSSTTLLFTKTQETDSCIKWLKAKFHNGPIFIENLGSISFEKVSPKRIRFYWNSYIYSFELSNFVICQIVNKYKIYKIGFEGEKYLDENSFHNYSNPIDYFKNYTYKNTSHVIQKEYIDKENISYLIRQLNQRVFNDCQRLEDIIKKILNEN